MDEYFYKSYLRNVLFKTYAATYNIIDMCFIYGVTLIGSSGDWHHARAGAHPRFPVGTSGRCR